MRDEEGYDALVGLKADFVQRYFENLKINERDYLKSKGRLVVARSGNEPFVVRSRLFDPKTGHLSAVHEVFGSAQQNKAAEFKIESEIGSSWGSGWRMRIASIPQAVTVLKFFADRFECRR